MIRIRASELRPGDIFQGKLIYVVRQSRDQVIAEFLSTDDNPQLPEPFAPNDELLLDGQQLVIEGVSYEGD